MGVGSPSWVISVPLGKCRPRGTLTAKVLSPPALWRRGRVSRGGTGLLCRVSAESPVCEAEEEGVDQRGEGQRCEEVPGRQARVAVREVGEEQEHAGGRGDQEEPDGREAAVCGR